MGPEQPTGPRRAKILKLPNFDQKQVLYLVASGLLSSLISFYWN